jgi:hypothetical protein
MVDAQGTAPARPAPYFSSNRRGPHLQRGRLPAGMEVDRPAACAAEARDRVQAAAPLLLLSDPPAVA